MTPRIQKAIDIFLDALNDGTLAKGTCAACAVTNLVAHGMNIIIPKKLYLDDTNESVKITAWSSLFCTSKGNQTIKTERLHSPDVISAIEATDFTWRELAAIEHAFETNANIPSISYGCHTKEEIRADQIKGLAAVVKVMLTFDDCKDSVEEVFTSKAELIPV